MKSLDQLKFFVLAAMSFIFLIGFTSCGHDEPRDSMEAAQQLNQPKSDATKESDERFLVRAAEFHLEEIIMGKLARQRGLDPAVQALGTKLENAHRDAKSAVASLAMIKSIAIPQVATQRSQDAYARLSEKMGEEFDLAYVDMMIQSHKDAINLYADATRGNNDGDVKNFAVGMLHELREYLIQSEQCESTLRNVSAALIE